MFPLPKRWYQTAGIKLASGNLQRSNAEIQQIWDKVFPEYVYNATFLDDTINEYYQQENRLSLMYKIYAALAIFISCSVCTDLFPSWWCVQKTKEVGIRKVFGASVQSILYLFSKEFTILVIIAFCTGPAAWYPDAYLAERFCLPHPYRCKRVPGGDRRFAAGSLAHGGV